MPVDTLTVQIQYSSPEELQAKLTKLVEALTPPNKQEVFKAEEALKQEAFTAAKTGAKRGPKPKNKVEAELPEVVSIKEEVQEAPIAADPDVVEAVKIVSREAALGALKLIGEEVGMGKAFEILQKFGCAKFMEIKEEDYAKLVKACDEVLPASKSQK